MALGGGAEPHFLILDQTLMTVIWVRSFGTLGLTLPIHRWACWARECCQDS